MSKRIKNEQEFLEKFEKELSNKFTLTPFDYKEKLIVPVEITCKDCGHVQKRKFYNLFKSKNCKSCLGVIKAIERNKYKLLTKEEFIKQLPLNFNYEVLDDIINTNKKVTVKDEYGICEIIGRNLIKGVKPSIEGAVNKTEYRLVMFNKIHNFKYNYPDYEFTKNSAKINFVCPLHGNQNIIETNHMKGFGCKDCTKKGTPRMKDEDFLQRVKDTGSGVEILEERGEYHTPILCRNKYGLVKISPDHLLKGSIGSFKTAIDKTAYKIEQFKEKHNNKYSYPNYTYCGNRCDAKIECPVHGEFLQSSDVHLMGSGCTSCSFIESGRVNGHSRTDFITNSKGRECTLYIVRMSDQKENFYKIGISSHSTEKRFKKSSDVKYNIDIIYELKSLDAGYIWDLEKEHHRKYKEFHYKPEIYFKGITECFSLNLPIEEIISYLESI